MSYLDCFHGELAFHSGQSKPLPSPDTVFGHPKVWRWSVLQNCTVFTPLYIELDILDISRIGLLRLVTSCSMRLWASAIQLSKICKTLKGSHCICSMPRILRNAWVIHYTPNKPLKITYQSTNKRCTAENTGKLGYIRRDRDLAETNLVYNALLISLD